MAEAPWLTIVGLGEDGPDGLCSASREALADADIVMGPARHLGLLPDPGAELVEWPVPFADGLKALEGFRGRRVVALVSGDPFWFGAGSVIAARLGAGEWRALPGRSTFSLAAARLGWPLETTLCLGLHAAPMTRLRPDLAPGLRAIVLLRDGAAVGDLAAYLRAEGFGESRLTVLEALGGPRERVSMATAAELSGTFSHPVCVALDVAGSGTVLPRVSGISDRFFETDGQITKRPVRALALSALAPMPGERLWDIGGGSGSIGIEWCLAHRSLRAIAIESRPERAARIRANADRFGLDRLRVVEGQAPGALAGLDLPHAVFVGGGLSEALMVDLAARLPSGTRLVAHAVTLESEALLAGWSARLGGELLRIELAEAAPLGARRGWSPSRPVVQWRVVL
ncbi:MAG: precorrin-6y C5,15-methyltransferase (decarboxylating) subunit CbiE [Rhodosalinus sp.]